MKPVKNKKQDEIAREWEKIADLRAEQIESGRDLSFIYILVPSVLELSGQSDFGRVIDIGCGPGFLTRELAKRSKHIVGIDMSGKNIEIAKSRFGDIADIEFQQGTVEGYSLGIGSEPFTLAVANMTLMTTLDLDSVLGAIRRLLKTKSNFVFTITHPWFWPLYWGYAHEEWFSYDYEIAIEAEFNISLDKGRGFYTTHIHRPLERYMLALGKEGFVISEVREPLPGEDVEPKYPERWKYPRFLAMCCTAE